MSHSHKCTTCHVMCHPIPDASKNVKFWLSRNPTKFDRVTRFRETNSKVKSVSSSEILKISGFQLKLPFYHFSEKLNFPWVLQTYQSIQSKNVVFHPHSPLDIKVLQDKAIVKCNNQQMIHCNVSNHYTIVNW